MLTKANAKFGGGTVTVFYFEGTPSPSEPSRLIDINSNPISAKTAYDAAMSGLVYIRPMDPALQNEIGYMLAIAFTPINTGEDITGMMFFGSGDSVYYAGDQTTGGNA